MLTPTLQGNLVRLEPLTLAHVPALQQFAFDESIWRYMRNVARTPADLHAYVQAALDLEAAGTAMPWATIALKDNAVVGTTRFYDLDTANKTVRIGSTWIDPARRRTGINVEAKLLQLTYAFETLGLNRVSLETHHENLPSQNAMRDIGATYEGIQRNYYIMPDGNIRHNVWFAFIREEWPHAKAKLQARLQSHA
jgi:RimJ/RimL family protein N-acetyltransferase